MIQKEVVSSINHLFRENQRTLNKSSVLIEDVAVGKRKIAQSSSSGVGDVCAWKRQRCSYEGERLDGFACGINDGAPVGMEGSMKGGILRSSNDDIHQNHQESSDGVTSIVAIDIPSSSGDCNTMEVDDTLDFINPEDYYEDKWH